MTTDYQEMNVAFHYGGALISADSVGRTAVCKVDMTDQHFNFEVLRWCDTYDEALTLLVIAFEDDE